MIIRVTHDHHFSVQSETDAEAKFLSWRLDSALRAKDKSYTLDAQEFMTLMRKFTKAKKLDEDGDD